MIQALSQLRRGCYVKLEKISEEDIIKLCYQRNCSMQQGCHLYGNQSNESNVQYHSGNHYFGNGFQNSRRGANSYNYRKWNNRQKYNGRNYTFNRNVQNLTQHFQEVNDQQPVTEQNHYFFDDNSAEVTHFGNDRYQESRNGQHNFGNFYNRNFNSSNARRGYQQKNNFRKYFKHKLQKNQDSNFKSRPNFLKKYKYINYKRRQNKMNKLLKRQITELPVTNSSDYSQNNNLQCASVSKLAEFRDNDSSVSTNNDESVRNNDEVNMPWDCYQDLELPGDFTCETHVTDSSDSNFANGIGKEHDQEKSDEYADQVNHVQLSTCNTHSILEISNSDCVDEPNSETCPLSNLDDKDILLNATLALEQGCVDIGNCNHDNQCTDSVASDESSFTVKSIQQNNIEESICEKIVRELKDLHTKDDFIQIDIEDKAVFTDKAGDCQKQEVELPGSNKEHCEGKAGTLSNSFSEIENQQNVVNDVICIINTPKHNENTTVCTGKEDDCLNQEIELTASSEEHCVSTSDTLSAHFTETEHEQDITNRMVCVDSAIDNQNAVSTDKEENCLNQEVELPSGNKEHCVSTTDTLSGHFTEIENQHNITDGIICVDYSTIDNENTVVLIDKEDNCLNQEVELTASSKEHSVSTTDTSGHFAETEHEQNVTGSMICVDNSALDNENTAVLTDKEDNNVNQDGVVCVDSAIDNENTAVLTDKEDDNVNQDGVVCVDSAIDNENTAVFTDKDDDCLNQEVELTASSKEICVSTTETLSAHFTEIEHQQNISDGVTCVDDSVIDNEHITTSNEEHNFQGQDKLAVSIKEYSESTTDTLSTHFSELEHQQNITSGEACENDSIPIVLVKERDEQECTNKNTEVVNSHDNIIHLDHSKSSMNYVKDNSSLVNNEEKFNSINRSDVDCLERINPACDMLEINIVNESVTEGNTEDAGKRIICIVEGNENQGTEIRNSVPSENETDTLNYSDTDKIIKGDQHLSSPLLKKRIETENAVVTLNNNSDNSKPKLKKLKTSDIISAKKRKNLNIIIPTTEETDSFDFFQGALNTSELQNSNLPEYFTLFPNITKPYEKKIHSDDFKNHDKSKSEAEGSLSDQSKSSKLNKNITVENSNTSKVVENVKLPMLEKEYEIEKCQNQAKSTGKMVDNVKLSTEKNIGKEKQVRLSLLKERTFSNEPNIRNVTCNKNEESKEKPSDEIILNKSLSSENEAARNYINKTVLAEEESCKITSNKEGNESLNITKHSELTKTLPCLQVNHFEKSNLATGSPLDKIVCKNLDTAEGSICIGKNIDTIGLLENNKEKNKIFNTSPANDISHSTQKLLNLRASTESNPIHIYSQAKNPTSVNNNENNILPTSRSDNPTSENISKYSSNGNTVSEVLSANIKKEPVEVQITYSSLDRHSTNIILPTPVSNDNSMSSSENEKVENTLRNVNGITAISPVNIKKEPLEKYNEQPVSSDFQNKVHTIPSACNRKEQLAGNVILPTNSQTVLHKISSTPENKKEDASLTNKPSQSVNIKREPVGQPGIEGSQENEDDSNLGQNVNSGMASPDNYDSVSPLTSSYNLPSGIILEKVCNNSRKIPIKDSENKKQDNNLQENTLKRKFDQLSKTDLAGNQPEGIYARSKLRVLTTRELTIGSSLTAKSDPVNSTSPTDTSSNSENIQRLENGSIMLSSTPVESSPIKTVAQISVIQSTAALSASIKLPSSVVITPLSAADSAAAAAKTSTLLEPAQHSSPIIFNTLISVNNDIPCKDPILNASEIPGISKTNVTNTSKPQLQQNSFPSKSAEKSNGVRVKTESCEETGFPTSSAEVMPTTNVKNSNFDESTQKLPTNILPDKNCSDNEKNKNSNLCSVSDKINNKNNTVEKNDEGLDKSKFVQKIRVVDMRSLTYSGTSENTKDLPSAVNNMNEETNYTKNTSTPAAEISNSQCSENKTPANLNAHQNQTNVNHPVAAHQNSTNANHSDATHQNSNNISSISIPPNDMQVYIEFKELIYLILEDYTRYWIRVNNSKNLSSEELRNSEIKNAITDMENSHFIRLDKVILLLHRFGCSVLLRILHEINIERAKCYTAENLLSCLTLMLTRSFLNLMKHRSTILNGCKTKDEWERVNANNNSVIKVRNVVYEAFAAWHLSITGKPLPTSYGSSISQSPSQFQQNQNSSMNHSHGHHDPSCQDCALGALKQMVHPQASTSNRNGNQTSDKPTVNSGVNLLHYQTETNSYVQTSKSPSRSNDGPQQQPNAYKSTNHPYSATETNLKDHNANVYPDKYNSTENVALATLQKYGHFKPSNTAEAMNMANQVPHISSQLRSYTSPSVAPSMGQSFIHTNSSVYFTTPTGYPSFVPSRVPYVPATQPSMYLQAVQVPTAHAGRETSTSATSAFHPSSSRSTPIPNSAFQPSSGRATPISNSAFQPSDKASPVSNSAFQPSSGRATPVPNSAFQPSSGNTNSAFQPSNGRATPVHNFGYQPNSDRTTPVSNSAFQATAHSIRAATNPAFQMNTSSSRAAPVPNSNFQTNVHSVRAAPVSSSTFQENLQSGRTVPVSTSAFQPNLHSGRGAPVPNSPLQASMHSDRVTSFPNPSFQVNVHNSQAMPISNPAFQSQYYQESNNIYAANGQKYLSQMQSSHDYQKYAKKATVSSNRYTGTTNQNMADHSNVPVLSPAEKNSAPYNQSPAYSTSNYPQNYQVRGTYDQNTYPVSSSYGTNDQNYQLQNSSSQRKRASKRQHSDISATKNYDVSSKVPKSSSQIISNIDFSPHVTANNQSSKLFQHISEPTVQPSAINSTTPSQQGVSNTAYNLSQNDFNLHNLELARLLSTGNNNEKNITGNSLRSVIEKQITSELNKPVNKEKAKTSSLSVTPVTKSASEKSVTNKKDRNVTRPTTVTTNSGSVSVQKSSSIPRTDLSLIASIESVLKETCAESASKPVTSSFGELSVTLCDEPPLHQHADTDDPDVIVVGEYMAPPRTLSRDSGYTTTGNTTPSPRVSSGKEEKQELVRSCSACPKPAVLTCSACRQVFYCTLECQKKHWTDIHSQTCIGE